MGGYSRAGEAIDGVVRQSALPAEARTRSKIHGLGLLGLAPGGVVQVWVRDSCNHPVKVARAQAEIEPLGPSQGKNEGRYAYPVSDKAKRYIDKYGIPYGSW